MTTQDYHVRRRLYRQLRRLVAQAEEYERHGVGTPQDFADLQRQLRDIISVLQEHRA